MFTQSWEDPECDRRALQPAPGETIFAITSGADNVLSFLDWDPARIIAIDLNPAQTFLAELKVAALRRLSHSDFLHFVGVRSPSPTREIYATLRGDLSEAAARYWDGRSDWHEGPLLLLGGFERYFAMLRRVLGVVIGRRRLAHLFTLAPAEQQTFYDEHWNTWRWRLFMRVLCSRTVLGNRLDPSWFEHADGVAAFGRHFEALAAHAIAELPARTNYFLSQIFLGRYVDEWQVPPYLQSDGYARIRERLDRLELRTADVGSALAALPDASIDAFALSNVFEYSPLPLFEHSRREIARVGKPGARLALRNLLARRTLVDDPAFLVDRTLSESLRLADRGFIYSRFEAARLAP
jgi:S-adenosylmethionine-diacylglycerol 3-amino-3-carboxypropyl transferase